MELWPGRSYPVGATLDGGGANFAVWAPVAEAVELCLFDAGGDEQRLNLGDQHAGVWHGYLPGAEQGLRYGYRVHGPFDPRRNQLCNPAKLLIDPYARAIAGRLEWHETLRTQRVDDPFRPDDRDSASHVPKALVVDPAFDWGDDDPPGTLLADSVIYEVHVRGATARHPGIEAAIRGTYLGLADPVFIEHLVNLGVTAIELLPIHHFLHNGFLLERGLSNYWGYDTIGYFAPHAEYAAAGTEGQQVLEVKRLVKAMHAAGIEVILDVVFNHTGEGGLMGPTVCLRGFDAGYYRSKWDDPTTYIDATGTGNTLEFSHPFVLQLIMDSLRHWVADFRVDGFRFDLAATLAREQVSYDRFATFFDLVQQDPTLRRVKLIAEPWDPGGRDVAAAYEVGNFPPLWAEWNGKFRDTVRDYWRGAEGVLPIFATRLAGSSDLFADDGRRPWASVNFVTSHDGFTLADLVAYERKHNDANGEQNRDGTDDNRSWNGGVEGPSADWQVQAGRARQQRNLLTTLLLAEGVPMLLGGDELGRTQQGNNNAYCQDNEISWFNWDELDNPLLAFTSRLLALRAANPVFRRRRFLTGRPQGGSPLPDSQWLRTDGSPFLDVDWKAPWQRAFAMFLNGDAITERGVHGESRDSQTFLIFWNAWWQPVTFQLPGLEYGAAWTPVVDTREWEVASPSEPVAAQAALELVGRSVAVLARALL